MRMPGPSIVITCFALGALWNEHFGNYPNRVRVCRLLLRIRSAMPRAANCLRLHLQQEYTPQSSGVRSLLFAKGTYTRPKGRKTPQ